MDITWEDLILETLPFRVEILNWCRLHPEFQKSLKVLASKRFLHLGTIVLSYPPGTNDEVIGIYAYDYKNNPPLFKQDFIVDLGTAHKEFVLYTGFYEKGMLNTKYVKHINEFFSKYGNNGNYADSHRLTFDQLPDVPEIKDRASRMIERSKNLPVDITHPTQQMMADYLSKIREVKVGKWTETIKLRRKQNNLV